MSFKIAEFSLHNGCTGLHSQSVDMGSPVLDYMPVGRLLAFDSDGKYMLTCASSGSLMYYVSSAFCVLKSLSGLEWFTTQRLGPGR